MAYLTRQQMFRALSLSLVYNNETMDTNADMVFKPKASNISPTTSQSEWAETFFDEIGNAQGLNDNWVVRENGATNTNAGISGESALLGLPNTQRREDWFNLLTFAHNLLEEIIVPGDDDFGSYGNPAHFDPEDTSDDRRTGGTLENAVKSELVGFRNYYTKEGASGAANLSQGKKGEYYSIAYAESLGNTKHIAPFNSFTNLSESGFKSLLRDADPMPRPRRFTFKPDEGSYSRGRRYCATRIVLRIFAVHNALYGSELKPLGNTTTFDDIKVNRSKFLNMLANVAAAYQILSEDISAWIMGRDARIAAAREAAEELLAEQLEELDFSVHKLTDSEIASISLNPQYNEYFTTTFNQDIITTVPIIHNLYLTEQYFEEISTVLLTPKIRAIDTLIDIILEDKDFNMKPNMDRPASRQAINAANGDFDFGPFLQDLIIKILIETPINILKGLVELIDPHIAITKMIKTGSMIAFSQGAKILESGPAESINELIKSEFPESDIKITGEGLMGMIVCMMEAGFTAGEMGLAAALNEAQGLDPDAEPPIPLNFFPTATLKGGIDFTGTVSGMVMAPPLPLGLLYLLLELIKNALNQTENLGTPPGETVCEDDEGGDNT